MNPSTPIETLRVTRRTLLGWGAAAAAIPVLSPLPTATPMARADEPGQEPLGAELDVEEMTVAEMQAAMDDRRLTSQKLTKTYLNRIRALDQGGPELRSVIETNPDAMQIALDLDRERHERGPRGPLHGIPVLLKDNIDTHDGMTTTAGSLALEGSIPAEDSTIAGRLRDAGAVILGKANMSEWANFRAYYSSSGWSARGGQCRNPYVLDRNPSGSSSGSAAAVAANLCAVSIGTETDGSIVCPACACNVVGIKPTVGLTSRAGVIPISRSQDTLGPLGRTVADAAAVLGTLTGVDSRDPDTKKSEGHYHTDYAQFLDPDGLNGARIGVPRDVYTGFSPEADAILEQALAMMRDAGAMLIDPAEITTARQMRNSFSEFGVLLYEFKAQINEYLAGLPESVAVHSLDELIAFNADHADREMPFFLQEILEYANTFGPLSDPEYLEYLTESRRLSRERGIDATMNRYRLDALVGVVMAPMAPTDLVNGELYLGSGPVDVAARAGYPALCVPAGFSFDIPVGIVFIGRAWSEPMLIRLASGFESVANARQTPRYLTTLDLNAPRGRPLGGSRRVPPPMMRPDRFQLRPICPRWLPIL